jgi:hypothetical protein
LTEQPPELWAAVVAVVVEAVAEELEQAGDGLEARNKKDRDFDYYDALPNQGRGIEYCTRYIVQ